MFSEKCMSENRRRRRRRRKTWLRPKQFSMSYSILRLPTNLIHNYRPPSIINEQVQCHIAQEPVLPISKTTAVAIGRSIRHHQPPATLLSLSALTSFIAWGSWKVYTLRLKSTDRRLRSKSWRLVAFPDDSFHFIDLRHSFDLEQKAPDVLKLAARPTS